MSKESFGEKISESMYKKVKAIEYISPEEFLKHDENFEIALCLAYMTLSKEKIIDKDIKNNDRLGRLTKYVDTNEINKVFTPGFSSEMPNIIYAKENNNLWILDNIRDSIMHGVFDIDEERKLFLINNNQYEREFIAEIPFSWFIAYAKNDILSKKSVDKYTLRGFYYNKSKKYPSHFETKKELVNNILYRINITGNKFNIKEIKNRINELLDIYSKEEVSVEDKEQYKDQFTFERKIYNENYLISFYKAKDKIKSIIEKEYPGTNLKIYIDNRKHKFINKTIKKLPKAYADYDLMFDAFNKEASSKGLMLLEYLSNLIEAINNEELKELSQKETNITGDIKLFNYILNKDYSGFDNVRNQKMLLDHNLKILRSICLNAYGLATLVINHETLYNNHFLNEDPSKYNIKAYIKKPFNEYWSKRKSLELKKLDIEIKLFEEQEQYSKCTDINAKQRIQNDINHLNTQIQNIENDLANLATTVGFNRYIKQHDADFEKMQQLEYIIMTYYDNFDKANNSIAKNKLRNIIDKLLTIKMEEESKFTFSYCTNMKDVLEIIRNSFSHIGRISI